MVRPSDRPAGRVGHGRALNSGAKMTPRRSTAPTACSTRRSRSSATTRRPGLGKQSSIVKRLVGQDKGHRDPRGELERKRHRDQPHPGGVQDPRRCDGRDQPQGDGARWEGQPPAGSASSILSRRCRCRPSRRAAGKTRRHHVRRRPAGSRASWSFRGRLHQEGQHHRRQGSVPRR